VAQAHGHHHHHHARSHRAARTIVFAPPPASSPVTPTTEPPHAATIASFAGGALTLTLTDGSTVKGTVTGDTQIECAAAMATARAADNGGNGDDQGQGDDSNEGNQQQGDDENQDEGDQGSSCGVASLQPPTAVREADLHIGPDGAVFTRIELIQ
jgi:hypothetical protein